MKLRYFYKFLTFILITVILFQVSCNNNAFDTIPNSKCLNANNELNVTGQFTEEGNCLYTEKSFAGKVDVLFIVDNSKSMSVEHSKMADKFSGFIQSLWAFDFQIAISTTDIENEPTRSGKFVTLSDGSKVLTNQAGMSISQIDQIFSNSIQRQETINCEIGLGNCPSSDVRGIYSANLLLRNNEQSFFRANTHLAIVFLSDADERVFGGTFGDNYPLDLNWDTPSSLVSSLNALGNGKTMSVHSIIINPGDESIPTSLQTNVELQKDTQCYIEQRDNSLGTLGYYGRQYFALSKPSTSLLAEASGALLEGTVGSICAENYSDVLRPIEQNIGRNTKIRFLRCKPISVRAYHSANPDLEVDFTFLGEKQIKISDSVSSDIPITIETECHNAH